MNWGISQKFGILQKSEYKSRTWYWRFQFVILFHNRALQLIAKSFLRIRVTIFTSDCQFDQEVYWEINNSKYSNDFLVIFFYQNQVHIILIMQKNFIRSLLENHQLYSIDWILHISEK